MQEHYEFAKSLRNLLRRADQVGYDLQTLKDEILRTAQTHESVAEKIEMDMVIQMQRDLVENS